MWWLVGLEGIGLVVAILLWRLAEQKASRYRAERSSALGERDRWEARYDETAGQLSREKHEHERDRLLFDRALADTGAIAQACQETVGEAILKASEGGDADTLQRIARDSIKRLHEVSAAQAAAHNRAAGAVPAAGSTGGAAGVPDSDAGR